jgi:hypothetical protein
MSDNLRNGAADELEGNFERLKTFIITVPSVPDFIVANKLKYSITCKLGPLKYDRKGT